MAEAPGPGDRRSLTFRVGQDRFAVAGALVREVGRMPRITPVPHAPPAMLGLGNFRGQVLPVLAPGGRAGAGGRRVIVLDTANPVALAVDAIGTFGTGGGLDAFDAEALAGIAGMTAPSPARRQATAAPAATAAIATCRPAPAPAREAEVPLVVFAIGAQDFALPIGACDEVLRLPDRIAILPHGDAAVIGSIALRDALLPLLSLAALLALPDGGGEARRHVVAVRIGAHRAGLVVDAVRGVLRVPESRIDPVPPLLARGTAEARVQAVCRLDGGRRLVSVLAADRLIHRELTALLLTAGPAKSMATSAPAEAAERFLIVRTGAGEFGLPIGAVIEVAGAPSRLAPLPGAPAFVKGVMALRGQAIPVIDQSLRFGGVAAGGGRVVVVRIGGLVAGLLVDAVTGLRRFAAGSLRPVPELGGEETRVFDRAAAGNGGDSDGADGGGAPVMLIVSPQELLDRAARDMLAAIGGTVPADPPPRPVDLTCPP